MRSFQITLTFMLLERIEQWNEQSWPIHSCRKCESEVSAIENSEAKLLSKAGGPLPSSLKCISRTSERARCVTSCISQWGTSPCCLTLSHCLILAPILLPLRKCRLGMVAYTCLSRQSPEDHELCRLWTGDQPRLYNDTCLWKTKVVQW